MERISPASELNYIELSDSTTMPEGNAVPALGGSSSSAMELESETSPCEQELSRRDICSCKKRKVQNDSDVIDDESDDESEDSIVDWIEELVEAIDEFREMYKTVEFIKCVNKRSKIEVLEKLAKTNEEKEERLQKFMVEQQVAMAKIIADAVKDAVGGRLDSPAD